MRDAPRVAAAAVAVVAGSILSFPLFAAAQTPVSTTGSVADLPRPTATASAVVEGPTLDGDVLNDPAWAAATPIEGFVQELPVEGAPVSEKTEVRVIFTKDTLYIGAVMYDREPGAIVVSDSRRDAPLDDVDSFRIIFDTYRDRQNGFVFGTNPAGVEYDGQSTLEGQGGGGMSGGGMQGYGSGGGFNVNWDGAWQVRTKISDIGWTAEFAIPFKTLRFPAGESQTWGVNFARIIRRHNERAYWAPIPRQFNLYRVSLAGSLSGIRTPAVRNFKLMPFVLGSAIASGVRPVDTETSGEVGGDLKYNLTPSLALDGTINTDFAQVEVDDQQVNLDRFNLFFPEKRPFFLENAGFFSVGNPGEVDLFFSRRIGLSASGGAIPIIAGARVSGKAGRYNVGLLNMQTNDLDNVVASNNFAVARISRDLPNRSMIGAIVVNRVGVGDLARDGDNNQTFGIDGRLGIRQNTVVSGFLAATRTPGVNEDVPAVNTLSYNLRSRTNLRKIDVDVGYQQVGKDFNPEVGFLTRDGYRKGDVRIMTRFRPKRYFQELRPHVTVRSFWGFDGFQESGYAHIDNHWVLKDSTEMHSGVNLIQEGVRVPFEIYPGIFVPAGDYKNAEVQPVLMTNQARPVTLSLQSNFGGFFSGHRKAISPTLRVRGGQTLTAELSYQRNDVDLPQGDFVTNLVRTRISYSFTPRIFAQTLIQYNDRADVWAVNLRLGWLQAANTGLFIVYNDTRGLYDFEPRRPERTDRSLVIKFSRMFDVFQ
ncbi:MAG: DUF5916 domain-containing protein [Vicinamibacterales bacterium]